MKYYIFVVSKGTERYSSLWKVDGLTAIRLGITDARNHKGGFYEVSTGESITTAIGQGLVDLHACSEPELYPLELEPGQYYPRMARPNDQHWHGAPGDNPGHYLNKNFIAMLLGS